MTNLNKEKFFFFGKECCEKKIMPNSVEHAYLAILNDELEIAETVFSKLESPRARWGCALVSILKGFMTVYPTYFEIRNFLEIDMDFLLKNNKISYVEQLLGAVDILSSVNQETYKYVARAMIENNLCKAGLKYMEKSKTIYYNDPELQFMYAKYYMDNQQYEEASFYVQECLKLLPDYYPALLIKQKIEEKEI